MKNFPMKKCYRVLYKIVCILCRNHATKTTYRTHCKFALGACLKFYINCLVSGANTILNISVIYVVVQLLRWQRRYSLRSLGVHTNGTPWINIAKILNVSIEQAKRSIQDEWFRYTCRPRSGQQLRGNRFTVWRILTVLYCTVLYCTEPDTPIRWTLRVVICHFQSWTFFDSL